MSKSGSDAFDGMDMDSSECSIILYILGVSLKRI